MKTTLTLFLGAAIALFAGCAKVEQASADSPKLLPNGTVAPNFTAMKADGTPVKLSDYAGKVVLVDFWATWCPPCKVSMPHLETLHKKLESQGLVVLGVCVWDEKAAFEAWDKKPEVPTSYVKIFDPAGRGSDNIASKSYAVNGIPTFYVVGKDGKIAYSGIGAGPDTEHGLESALKAVGFKL